jgi:predicted enzyme related to lactoylglutathione lyase
MASRVVIADIIIDASHPEELARFWSRLLDRAVQATKGPYVVLERDGRIDLGMAFQRVEEPKRGKNRVHFDVSSPDIPATKALIEAMGGRRVPGYEEGGFLVMADPEGNEFCVVPAAEIEVDRLGRATYLDGLGLGP